MSGIKPTITFYFKVKSKDDELLHTQLSRHSKASSLESFRTIITTVSAEVMSIITSVDLIHILLVV